MTQWLDDGDDFPTVEAKPALNGHDSLSDIPPCDDWTADVPPAGVEGPASPARPWGWQPATVRPQSPLEAAEWPEPFNFWGGRVLPTVTERHLPPAMADFVLTEAARAGVDPAQVALNCYVISSALIRSSIKLQMQPDGGDGRTWRETAILWGAVIGDASTRKKAGMDIAIYKFKEIASQLRAKDEAAWKRWDDDDKTHQKALQAWHSERIKNPGAMRPEAPEKPPRERLWTDDVTKEVVAKLITENPRGKIAIIKDELAGWFGSFDAYTRGSDKDRPDWLSFYESGERYIDRAMEGRSYHVPSWGGCIIGGIQPDVITRIADKLGSDGMLQRFMLITSRPAGEGDDEAPPDRAAVSLWNHAQQVLAEMHAPQYAIQLSAEARAFMREQMRWTSKTMRSAENPALVAALGKWGGLYGRLMLTSHCIAEAAAGRPMPGQFVSLETAEQAWAWMSEILWPHAIRFYEEMGDTQPIDISQQTFARFVLARDLRIVGVRALAQNWTHYKRKITTIQHRREFWDAMCNSGWVRPSGGPDRTGNIATQYTVNPAVFDGRFKAEQEAAALRAQQFRDAEPEAFRQPRAEP